ncbi:hypothetical protein CH273_25845 [Rhodococcus sp. 05-339-2]|uniref:SGNH/GDSL hydrolase family protein n=1 Tax=Rhodococcoides fascians TaxID=1828 RepID=UPI00068BBC0D|nr:MULTISPECIES: GDSL-type esterase/lipase family protein [Rhodococcus]OZD74911.1 hypothetical protein CH273_25845 [Rhodococcus sp. 05-339-2]
MGVLDAPALSPKTAALTYRSRKNSTIVWWGDSNTANGSNGSLSTRPGSFWPWANIMLGHRLRTLKNAGVGGETSTQILARFDADVKAFAPAWVHILAGTNDAGDTAVAVPLATTQANILAMIDKCREIGARVLVGTIPPRNTRTTASRAHAMGLNGWIRQLPYLQPDVIVVDYFGVLADPAVADNWIAGYAMDDNTHFRGIGACTAGKLLADTLRSLVPPLIRVSRVHAVDPTNLLSSQGLFQGAAAGTAPSGWTASNASYISGLVDRTDGIPGKWLQVVVPDGGTFSLSRNGDPAVATGETAIFAVEFEATGLQAVATSGTQYLAAEFNVPSGIFPSELSHVSGGSGDPIHGNMARSGVLETPPYTRLAADTQLRPMISIAGGGTYRFACGTVTKL